MNPLEKHDHLHAQVHAAIEQRRTVCHAQGADMHEVDREITFLLFVIVASLLDDNPVEFREAAAHMVQMVAQKHANKVQADVTSGPN